MGRLMVVALRTALAATLAGSVFVQAVMVPLMAIDLKEADPDAGYRQIPFAVVLILIIVTVQVALVCVWQLVTMVRRGTIFTRAAFRYVDVIIGAAAAATLLLLALGFLLAPGEAVAPGVVLLIGGGAVIAAAIGLVVLALRRVLAQAIARDAEAHELRAELAEVI